MILFLDTTDLNRLHFALLDAGPKKIKLIQVKRKIAYEETHKTLELLANFLKKNKINLSLFPSPRLGEGKSAKYVLSPNPGRDRERLGDKSKALNHKSSIVKLFVCSGPGSFTGTRIGVTIAQALNFALDIPAVAIKKADVPKNLKKLAAYRGGKKLVAEYNRPAV